MASLFFPQDLTLNDRHRLKRHLNVILSTFLAFTLVMTQLERTENRIAAVVAVSMACILLLLVHRDRLLIPAYLAPLTLLMLFTVFILYGEGIGDISIYGYFLVVALSGLLLPRNATLAFTGLSLIMVIIAYFLGKTDLDIPSAGWDYSLTQLSYVCTYIIAAAIVIQTAMSSLRKSVDIARHSAHELASLNTTLEQRVEERTQALDLARQEAELIAEISSDMTRSRTEVELLRAFTRIAKPFNYTTALLLYVDYLNGQPDTLRTVAAVTITGAEVALETQPITVYRREDFMMQARIFAADAPIYVENGFTDSGFGAAEHAALKAFDISAMVFVPLKTANQWQAVLLFNWRDPQTFPQQFKDLLSALIPRLSDNVAARRAYLLAQEARQETEILFKTSQAVNKAMSYAEILQAMSQAIPMRDFDMALSLFENNDLEQATYATVMAILPAGASEAIEAALRYPINNTGISSELLTHIPDMDNAPPEIAKVYLASQTKATLIALFSIGGRVVGALSFTSSQARYFSEQERRLIRGLGDLAAAAVERSRLYAEQVKMVEELRVLDTMKSQFLASMSHELRTPLNAILNFTEFMSLGILGEVNEKQKDALGKTLSSGRHLLALINDVLDMTKIQSGMMKLFVEDDVNLPKELSAVIAATEPLLKDKPVQFITDIDPDLPIMVGDKRRIRQVLLNLLSNAAKFTEQGTITLSAKCHDQKILFMVSDTGPGIAKKDFDLIFEPFRQTDTGIQHMGGTGLGLPISRKLVEAHGGDLWVESEPGQGTAFYFTLPVRSQELLAMIKLPETTNHVFQ